DRADAADHRAGRYGHVLAGLGSEARRDAAPGHPLPGAAGVGVLAELTASEPAPVWDRRRMSRFPFSFPDRPPEMNRSPEPPEGVPLAPDRFRTPRTPPGFSLVPSLRRPLPFLDWDKRQTGKGTVRSFSRSIPGPKAQRYHD